MKENGVPPNMRRASSASAGAMFMWLFIGSLSILFISSLVIYFFFRARAAVWPPPGIPALPSGLWLSTVLIVLSSITLHSAVVSTKADKRQLATGWLWATLALGLTFLAMQSKNWLDVFSQGLSIHSQYGGLFYFLTVLHALHVVGGIIGLVVTGLRAAHGAYRPGYYPGLGLMGIYWHFLAVLWLVLFAVLMGTA